jgi:hypothetical protein
MWSELPRNYEHSDRVPLVRLMDGDGVMVLDVHEPLPIADNDASRFDKAASLVLSQPIVEVLSLKGILFCWPSDLRRDSAVPSGDRLLAGKNTFQNAVSVV